MRVSAYCGLPGWWITVDLSRDCPAVAGTPDSPPGRLTQGPCSRGTHRCDGHGRGLAASSPIRRIIGRARSKPDYSGAPDQPYRSGTLDRPVRQESVMLRRFAVAVFGVVLVFSGLASAASAQTGPTITFFKSPLPVLGQTTGDSTPYLQVPVKDGWTLTSANGVAHGDVSYCQDTDCSLIWYANYPSPGPAKVTGKYQWVANLTTRVTGLTGEVFDQLSNRATSSDLSTFNGIGSSQASYSGIWRSSYCTCYINHKNEYSTQPGATTSSRYPTAGWSASSATRVPAGARWR